DSAIDFVRKMIKSGHHAMIEFAVPPSVKVITDRGVTHEIVRHRLFSFAQESTRYCNYEKNKFGNQITVVLPVWFYNVNDSNTFKYDTWEESVINAEKCYMELIASGQSPQEARSVLPNSLKAEINMSCNVREWRHFFSLRCNKAAHPQMRELALDILNGFNRDIPVIFEDIFLKYSENISENTPENYNENK
ncbi:MAG TPA: FAD-dependent thymidylate synthase, partial [Candidatus Pacearchaeota archaeon]|nr:FAD-dependent thymidylate synthase [Candidatus Pacearchaeota archaeon]